MVRIVPSEVVKTQDPQKGVHKKVTPAPEDRPGSDMLQKDPAQASRLAEVIQMFRKKREPRLRNRAIKRYAENQDFFEVGDPLGFRIDKKV